MANFQDWITNYLIPTHNEIADRLKAALTALGNKVNVEAGKGLSSNDFTNALKTKLDNIVPVDLVDNLTTADATKGLSANMGVFIKSLIDAEKARIDAINTILGSDNANLDTLQELVDFVEGHQTELNSLVNTYIKKTDSINNLTTTTAGKVLDARQGKALKDLIDGLQTSITANTNSITAINNDLNDTRDLKQLFIQRLTS